MSQKNRKVKRSKGRLYKKKKSSAKKVFEVILMVLIVGVLGVVGYAAAGPLISYIQSNNGDTSVTTPWEPPESSTPPESSETSDSESSPDTTTDAVPDGSGSYLLPESALSSQTALTSALDQAKAAGLTKVIVPVKNGEGYLLYHSYMSAVKDTELIKGTMPAGQIVSLIKDKGFTSVKALVPTLYDRTTPANIDDTGYRFANDSYSWLDASASNGGKRWVDPFRAGTKQYYSNLAKELIAAGFDEVLLSELKYPVFSTYDMTILEEKFFSSTRYTALTELYKTSHTASGDKAAVAVNIADVLKNYGKSYGGTAEILTDKSFTGTVYLMIDLNDFGTQLVNEDKTTTPLSADPAQKTKTLVSRAAEYLGTNVTVIPVIEPSGLSADALGRCYSALQAE